MSVLFLDNLSRSFGSLRAVDGVTLSIRAGGITGLIGPNGAGKTTLFNLVAGSLAPDAGSIRFEGRAIEAMPPDERFRLGLARTFQIPRPFPAMTVLDNLLTVPLGQTGERFWNAWLRPGVIAAEEKRHREKAREVLAFTTLAPLAEAPARTLSGGQRKLLELSRILMAEPKLVLLDEPAAGVAPALVDLIAEKIADLNRRGLTFLLIEHDMDLVRRLCDPVIVMARGQVLAEGTAQAVVRDPRVVDAYLGDAAA